MDSVDDTGLVLDQSDWDRLVELRAVFLNASTPASPASTSIGSLDHGSSALRSVPDYWRDRRDLEIYDATLGARIGWKWRAVMAEVARRATPPRGGMVVDWGTGSGVAARAWLAAYGAVGAWRMVLHDRSRRALEYARDSIVRAHPAQASENMLETTLEPPDASLVPDVLLVSHVQSELEPAALDRLVALAQRAAFVVWVEAGSRAPARALSEVRERLLATHVPRAPCTHAAACGALANDRDWCHGFATPDPTAFTSAHWARLGRTLGIDLRSLPYAYLVLARRDEGVQEEQDPSLARLLGRPAFTRGRAKLRMCSRTGHADVDFLERTDRKLFRALREPEMANGAYAVELEGSRLRALHPR